MITETSELTGAALDWAVLEASNNPNQLAWRKANGELQVRMPVKLLNIIQKNWEKYSPSTIWSQGGPIIDQEKIEFRKGGEGMWASYHMKPTRHGKRISLQPCAAI